jgi:hypothetical protein
VLRGAAGALPELTLVAAERPLAALTRNRSSWVELAPARTAEAVRSDDGSELRDGCGPLREVAFPSCAAEGLTAPARETSFAEAASSRTDFAPSRAARDLSVPDTDSVRADFAPSRAARDVSVPDTDSARADFVPARPARDVSFAGTASSRADFAPPLPARDTSFPELASAPADFGASRPARDVARAFTSASSAPTPGVTTRPFTSRVSAATAAGWAAAGRGRFLVSSAPASFASEPSFTAVDFDDARAMARPL